MDGIRHNSINDLFEQLGLPSSDSDIDQFIANQLPIPPTIEIYEAPFWTESQATFLREEAIEDAEWSVTIDELSVRLR